MNFGALFKPILVLNFAKCLALVEVFACVLVYGSQVLVAQELPFVGPIEIENQYPLMQLHRSFAPTDAEVLPQHTWQFRTSGTWSNTSTYEDDYTTDVETWQQIFRLRHSLLADSDLEISVPLLWRGAGILDSAINGWHSSFHLPAGDRKRVSDNTYDVSGTKEDRYDYSIPQSGLNLGTLALKLKQRILDKNTFAITYQSTFALPSAQSGYGQGSFDSLQGLILQKKYELLAVYGGLSWVYYDDTNVSGLRYYPNHAEWFFSLEYPLTNRTSASCSIFGSSGAVRGIVEHPGYENYLDLGISTKINDSTRLELLLRENPGPGAGSADVSFYFGLVFQSEN